MSGKGKGKRRGTARDSGGAKRRSGTKEGDNAVAAVSDQPDHSGNASNSKVKDVVDFEAVLISADMQLPPASQSVSAAQNQGTEDVLANVFHSLKSAPGQNVESVRCSGDEIFAHVPKTLRQQICKGEYINLALLLKGGMELKDFCSGGSLKLNTDGGIEMKAKVCKDKIGSVEKWTDAFLIFASVYLTVYPDKAPELLHYMFIIHEAAIRQKGFCWRDYDEQFRIRQSNNLSSWAVINNDLWLRCMQVKDTGVGMEDSSGQFKSYTCHDFNKGVCRWPSPCRYPHTCSTCASPLHGAFACPNKTHSPNSQQTFNLTPFRGRPNSRYQRGRGPRSTGNFGKGAGQRTF